MNILKKNFQKLFIKYIGTSKLRNGFMYLKKELSLYASIDVDITFPNNDESINERNERNERKQGDKKYHEDIKISLPKIPFLDISKLILYKEKDVSKLNNLTYNSFIENRVEIEKMFLYGVFNKEEEMYYRKLFTPLFKYDSIPLINILTLRMYMTLIKTVNNTNYD